MNSLGRSILMGVILLISTPLWSQESLSGLNRQIRRVEKETDREKKLHKAEKQKAKSFEQRKKQKLKALVTQKGEMQSQIKKLKVRLSQLKGQKYAVKNQTKQLKNKRMAVSQHLVQKIDGLIVYFKQDFPYQRQRNLDNLSSLKKELQEEIIGPEEGMNRLFTLLSTAISNGYETQVYSDFYTDKSGKTIEGKFLRMGTVLSVFVSMDGNTVAYLTHPDSTYQWNEEMNLELKQNIKEAIKISEGKAAPSLVLLPFSAPTEKREVQ